MNGRPRRLVRCGLAAFLLASARVDAGDDVTADMEAMVRRAFAGATAEEIATRLEQDEVQALCSRYRNRPPDDVAARILESQMRTVRFPDDGRLLGDWREGEKLASSGRGGHIGFIQPDPPGTPRGGNCYACHELAKKEVAYGTIGPSLRHFGRLRGGGDDVVRYAYEKIYNSNIFMACTNMPRFGLHSWLTPEQITHLVAFLIDPESPVNKD